MPRALRSALLVLLLPVLLLLGACRNETGPAPTPAVHPLGASGEITVDPADRCPVCAMRIAEHERTSAAIEVEGGRAFLFCGNGCMIRAWMDPAAHLGVDRGALRRAVARDGFSGAFLDARQAFWVAGSDAMGPMGRMVVPFGTEADAGAFSARHGGQRTFRLDDLDAAAWASIQALQRAAP